MKLFWQIIIVFIVITVPIVLVSTKKKSQVVYNVNEIINTENKNRIRVVGRVSNKEIIYKTTPKHILEFYINEITNPKDSLKVTYEGLKPDMFDVGRDVIIDGDYIDNKVIASTLLTQCPSKYEAKKPE